MKTLPLILSGREESILLHPEDQALLRQLEVAWRSRLEALLDPSTALVLTSAALLSLSLKWPSMVAFPEDEGASVLRDLQEPKAIELRRRLPDRLDRDVATRTGRFGRYDWS